MSSLLLRVSVELASARFGALVNDGVKLRNRTCGSSTELSKLTIEATKWRERLLHDIGDFFTEPPIKPVRFCQITTYETGIFPYFEDIDDELKTFHEQVVSNVDGLNVLIRMLGEHRLVIPHSLPIVTAGNAVFVVHGHDSAAKHGAARFLGDLGLEPIILDEQANQGGTVIEKFEREAERATFALVLLTGDDKGGAKAVTPKNQLPRARQNVVFELGYFAGKLGRKRVCALYAEGVEIPSDYSGIVYVPLDEHGGWKMKLAKELKVAGFAIDLNRLS